MFTGTHCTHTYTIQVTFIRKTKFLLVVEMFQFKSNLEERSKFQHKGSPRSLMTVGLRLTGKLRLPGPAVVTVVPVALRLSVSL